MVLPVPVSMLARMTVSVRVPVRFLSASPPEQQDVQPRLVGPGVLRRRVLGVAGQGGERGRVALLDSPSLLNTVPTRLACS